MDRMIKNKKVSAKEVKRAFVIAQLIRRPKGRKHYLGPISLKEFEKRLKNAKSYALKLSETRLDIIIGKEYKRRLRAYNDTQWYIGTVRPTEVGVWRKAGGLPKAWTRGSLQQTATKVKRASRTNPKLIKKRARHSIQYMLNTNVSELQKEKYLWPIVFKKGHGTRGRRGLLQMQGDIDDGCMRSIALTINGAKSIRVYIGYPKKKGI